MNPTEGVKYLLRRSVGKVSWATLQWRLTLAYRLWGIEGVDRILMLCKSDYVGRILTRFGAVLGNSHTLHSPLLIHNATRDYSNLTIGEYCHLGKEVFLDLAAAITIEDQATISMGTMILTHMDVGHSPLRKKKFPVERSPVTIRRGAYLGAGAIVLQGVTVGECAVVGAGAVVVEDVPSSSVVTGVPARVIKYVYDEDERKLGADLFEHH